MAASVKGGPKMKTIRTEAIVLHASDYGESDRIVRFCTRDRGIVKGIAKGARRSRKRFANTFEPGSEVLLSYRERRGLAWIEACRLQESHSELRSDLARWAMGNLFCEFTLRMVPEGLTEPEVYDLLQQGLAQLGRDRDPWNVATLFLLRFMGLMGTLPLMEACAVCRCSVQRSVRDWIWDLERGRLCCAVHGNVSPEGVRLDVGTVFLVRMVRQASLEKLWRLRFRKSMARKLAHAVVAWGENQIGRPLKSMKIVVQMEDLGPSVEERTYRGMDETV